jgi:phosphoglucosamine mutase
MTRKYFGTDGMRGEANRFPMTADMALKVAMACAHVLGAEEGNGAGQNRVVIGKDTRLSGYMLEQAMAAGFVAMGMEVILTGPIPTPAVAMLTKSLRADVGVMISASHNPYQDNGIKLFGADGFKLSDDMEHAIEAIIDRDDIHAILPPADMIGKARRLEDADGRYAEFLKNAFPKNETLKGLKIVVDCAHGAAYRVAPKLLWELEADVHAIGTAPDGKNINLECGATDTRALQEAVVSKGADIGLAFDGDADRLIVIDEKGQRIDGDQIMALLALTMKQSGTLSHDTVVTTVMSNLGFERFLKAQGVAVVRTGVGDRYVVEEMRRGGFNLGGEQSGHMILSDIGTTGDGLLAALQVLAAVKQSGKTAGALCHMFEPVPQILKNVRYQNGDPLNDNHVKAAIATAEKALNENGRILIRKSGTEPLIRVMAEGDDMKQVEGAVDQICAALEKAAV